jgi:hypothetical protein
MLFDGLFGRSEQDGNVTLALALRDPKQHFSFSRRQAEQFQPFRRIDAAGRNFRATRQQD